jgi:hypothetical protein
MALNDGSFDLIGQMTRVAGLITGITLESLVWNYGNVRNGAQVRNSRIPGKSDTGRNMAISEARKSKRSTIKQKLHRIFNKESIGIKIP